MPLPSAGLCTPGWVARRTRLSAHWWCRYRHISEQPIDARPGRLAHEAVRPFRPWRGAAKQPRHQRVDHVRGRLPHRDRRLGGLAVPPGMEAAGGRLGRIVNLPCGWSTSCAFGGSGLDTLFVIATADADALTSGHPLRDARALSVAIPLDLETRTYRTWPAFLLDLLPQGHARRKLAQHLNLDADSPSAEIHLLLRGAGAPIGNIRIKEAHLEEIERLKGAPRLGVTRHDIEHKTDKFLEVADRFAMIASGSSGLQGEWPKVAMTKARDGLWYPDPAVEDDDAIDHVIVKLLRSNERTDRLILEAEAAYASVAIEFGVRVRAAPSYHDGVLIIPRFDRKVTNRGLERFGQESLVSTLGVAEFGHIDFHENYLREIRKVSTSLLDDAVEYVVRDALNLAMGNSDNHGRNTALSKTDTGEIRLSPLFDFAPMILAPADMGRPTKWECMRSVGRDYSPDWAAVCEAAAGDDLPASVIMEALSNRLPQFRAVPEIARRHGVTDEVVERAIEGRFREITNGIEQLGADISPSRSR